MAEGTDFFRTNGKYPKSVGILSLGGLNLGAAKMKGVGKLYKWMGEEVAKLTTTGRGSLVDYQAKQLVTHLKDAIIKGGKGVPGYTEYSYDDYYEKWKGLMWPENASKNYYASGQLLANIKVLNRRLAGGGRGKVAGVAQNKYVNSLTSPGKKRPLDKIVLDLEYGHRSGKGRMLLSYATQDFLNKFMPATSRRFFEGFWLDTQATKVLVFDKLAYFDQTMPDGETVNVADTAVSQAVEQQLEMKTSNWSDTAGTDKIYIKALRESGESAERIAEMIKLLNEGFDE